MEVAIGERGVTTAKLCTFCSPGVGASRHLVFRTIRSSVVVRGYVDENGPPRVGLLVRRVSLTIWRRRFLCCEGRHVNTTNDGDVIYFGFDGADICV